jgi:putative nucleotidyltransferase with HDIG domain
MSQEESANPAVEAFLYDHQCLNAMPENSIRILKMMQDVNFGMKQLAKLIEQDAAIAAKVIQTVNSAAYARANRITQLDRATVYLGFKTVKEIVVATTVQSVCRPVTIGKYAIRDLWDHSVGVAVLCREFANRSKAVDPELAFLAGILHDIGLLLSAQSEVGTSSEVFEDAADQKTPFMEVEKSYFGFDHCELGDRLAAGWNFPAEVAAAIRWHHSPQQAPEPFRTLCLHVFIADTLCAEAAVGFPLTTLQQKVNNDILAEAGLAREQIDEVMQRFRMLLRLHSN